MCLELFAKIFKTYKEGGTQGNIPSPRVDVTIGDLFSYKTTTVQNTNSMEPLIDIGHTVLITDDISGLNIGDIIIFTADERLIIHSIIEIGDDGEWYCKTQGLNINSPDPYIIRKSDISYLALGVLWTKDKGYSAEEGD